MNQPKCAAMALAFSTEHYGLEDDDHFHLGGYGDGFDVCGNCFESWPCKTVESERGSL